MRHARYVLPFIALVLLVYLASKIFLDDETRDNHIAYSDLIVKVVNQPESIRNIDFVPKGQKILVTLTDGSELRSNYPTDGSQVEFQRKLETAGVHFDSKGTTDSGWWSILTYLLPFLLFFGFWIFLMRSVRNPDKWLGRRATGDRHATGDPYDDSMRAG